MSKNRNSLTKQQQAFCDYRRSHPGKADHVIYAKFYSPKSVKSAEAGASRLLSNVKVLKYLSKKQEIAEKLADYRQEQWVQDILKLKRMCMAEEDIVLITEYLDKNNEVAYKELKQRGFNPAGANKALEIIGKFKKWLSDKPNIHVGDNNTQNNHPMVFVPAEMDDGND